MRVGNGHVRARMNRRVIGSRQWPEMRLMVWSNKVWLRKPQSNPRGTFPVHFSKKAQIS